MNSSASCPSRGLAEGEAFQLRARKLAFHFMKTCYSLTLTQFPVPALSVSSSWLLVSSGNACFQAVGTVARLLGISYRFTFGSNRFGSTGTRVGVL